MKLDFKRGLVFICVTIVTGYLFLPAQFEQQKSVQANKLNPISDKISSVTKKTNSPDNSAYSEISQGSQIKSVWESIKPQQRPDNIPDSIHIEYIKANPAKFSEGQQVSFLIPQEQRSYYGTINESTRAFNGKVKISSGELEENNQFSSFSITEGEKATFVTVATGESIYQVEIDNQSGIGTVIDDRELNQYRQNEDGVLPPPEGVS